MSYSAEKVDEALALVDSGKSHSEVGRLLKIPQVNISRWVRKRHANNGVASVIVPDTDPTPPPNVPQKIALASLCLTAGTQMRESLNLTTIAEYADAMSDGAKFPPVIVFTDGETYWLADGFQREKAAEQVGYPDIAADIRPGTLRDAILFACGANSTHGDRRTNRDKRKSVLALIEDAEWSKWSDRRIADVCGVSHPFVSEIRQSLVTVTSDDSSTRQYVTKHGTTTTMDTSNIGKRAPGERKTRPSEPPSNELPLAENGDALPPVGITFRTTTLALCATCERVRPLLDEALAQLDHGVFCISPRNSTFQKCTSRMDRSVFL